MTQFIVLKSEPQTDESAEDLWRFVGYEEAPTFESAIRVYVESAPDPDGTYVAIATRRFDPKVVRTEKVTKVKLA